MMRYLRAGVLTLALTGSAAPQIQIAGAWHTVEARDAGGQDITDRTERNIFIFSRSHFSTAWSELDRPRFTGQITDSQKVASWQDFGAQAGRYQLVGDTLVLYTEIAKSPGAMIAGAFQKYTVRRAGNDIWLQLVADNSGSLTDQERIRLARLD